MLRFKNAEFENQGGWIVATQAMQMLVARGNQMGACFHCTSQRMVIVGIMCNHSRHLPGHHQSDYGAVVRHQCLCRGLQRWASGACTSSSIIRSISGVTSSGGALSQVARKASPAWRLIWSRSMASMACGVSWPAACALCASKSGNSTLLWPHRQNQPTLSGPRIRCRRHSGAGDAHHRRAAAVVVWRGQAPRCSGN